MPSATYELVRQAIASKQCMRGTYNDYVREMCPHTLGYNKNGEEQALFYQFGGDSSKGLEPAGSPKNWRCIPLAALANAEIIGGEWQGGPNHSQPQTCVADIRHEVAY